MVGYVYATINKDTLAHICKEKGVSSEFLASKTKLNMSRLNQWLTPTDINLPTINQAKKIAACLHMPFAGLYMNPCDIPLKRIPNIRNMRTMSGAVSIDDSSLNIAMIDVLLERDFLLSADDEFGITPPDRKIVTENPKMIEFTGKSGTSSGDAFLIATAMKYGLIIITEENKDKQMKIPQISKKYGITSVNITSLCEMEQWKF